MNISIKQKLSHKSNIRLTLSALTVALGVVLSGCGSDNDDDSSTPVVTDPTYQPIELTIAHMNDHHSHLEAEGTQDFVLNNKTYQVERGGFARITQFFNDLSQQYNDKNFIKLHAGDAITGTQYFSFYKGEADAKLMNTICFDAFALGNHEFDESDSGLVKFLDDLNNGSCSTDTPVLAANVVPKIGTPLAKQTATDYIRPYIVKTTKEGVQVGIIGIDIAGKTKNSSRPLTTTEFLDETVTAQNYINELTAKGIEHIILMTHYTYENDKKLAAALTDVDAIIGGDSHTLLGNFTGYTGSAEEDLGAKGEYPTLIKNKDGDTVCIGQAWEYTKAVGLMNISFDKAGKVSACVGSSIILTGTNFTQPVEKTVDGETKTVYEPVDAATNQMILTTMTDWVSDNLFKTDVLYPYQQSPTALAALKPYQDKLEENEKVTIATATQTACLVRVPGTSRSTDLAGCKDSDKDSRGSDAAQIVAAAFLDGSLRADFALQNAGGVRTAIPKGDVTFKTAYELLPFSNTLVNLDITGAQVVDSLEEAIANHMDGDGSSGSHPYAAGLRWDLDLSKAEGSRISNVEVKDRNTGNWSAIDMNKTYVMVTNDYIAEGRDGYTTLGNIYKDSSKVEDTKLLYTQSFIDYMQKKKTIDRPARSDYSHKSVIVATGDQLK